MRPSRRNGHRRARRAHRVVVPLNTSATYAQTKAFARDLAGRLAGTHPDLVVDRMTKAIRAGRVFVDWAQNDARKQTVAAYSLRVTPIPSVSAPVAWGDVERAASRADPAALRRGPDEVVASLRDEGDLFAPAADLRQTLPVPPYAV